MTAAPDISTGTGGTDVLAGIEARRAVLADRAGIADLDERVSRLETLIARLMFSMYEHAGAGRSESGAA